MPLRRPIGVKPNSCGTSAAHKLVYNALNNNSDSLILLSEISSPKFRLVTIPVKVGQHANEVTQEVDQLSDLLPIRVAEVLFARFVLRHDAVCDGVSDWKVDLLEAGLVRNEGLFQKAKILGLVRIPRAVQVVVF